MNIDTLVGKTFHSVTSNADSVFFEETNGTSWKLQHNQECCESVWLEDVAGDLTDLIGVPILHAEECFSSLTEEDKKMLTEEAAREFYYGESATWSFYKISTIKGSVTLRFLGVSNGCYGEEASLCKRIVKGGFDYWSYQEDEK